jgi:hypothetical protein
MHSPSRSRIVFLVFVVVIAMVATACGNSSSDDATSTKEEDTTITLEPAFVNKVNAACKAFENNLDAAQTDDIIFEPTDPVAIQNSFSASENTYDALISDLTALDPPEDVASDWETLMDDLAAIRDSFPELANIWVELAKLSAAADIYDPESPDLEKNNDRALELNDEYSRITKSNEQRAAALEEFTKTYQFDGCDSLYDDQSQDTPA